MTQRTELNGAYFEEGTVTEIREDSIVLDTGREQIPISFVTIPHELQLLRRAMRVTLKVRKVNGEVSASRVDLPERGDQIVE
jgi:hypothetical protein